MCFFLFNVEKVKNVIFLLLYLHSIFVIDVFISFQKHKSL